MHLCMYMYNCTHIHRKSSLYLPLGSVNLVLKAMGTSDEISSPPGWNRVSPGCPRNFSIKLTEPIRQIKTTFPMNMHMTHPILRRTTHIYIYTHARMYICVCMYICIYTCIYTCVYAYKTHPILRRATPIYIYTHTHTHTYIYIYKYICTYVYIHTNIHICIYT